MSSPQLWLAVGVGGAIGAMARHAVGAASLRLLGPNFPWGTLTVNVAGSLAMGLFIAWLVAREPHTSVMRAFVATGVLGGFTTFSTFALDVDTGSYTVVRKLIDGGAVSRGRPRPGGADEPDRLRRRFRLESPPGEIPPGGLQILGIDYPGPLWAFRHERVAEGVLVLTLTGKGETLPEGEHAEFARVRTNHPLKPVITLHLNTSVRRTAGRHQ